MAQPLYFVEGVDDLTQADADAIGIGYAFNGRLSCGRYTGAGPGGKPGCVCSVSDDGRGFYPDRQRWRQIQPSALASDRVVHVGYWLNSKPTPEELLATGALRGRVVRLCDGQDWIVPTVLGVRQSAYGVELVNYLPRVSSPDDSGHWSACDLSPAHANLLRLAMSWWNLHCQGEERGKLEIRVNDMCNACASALSVNYRVNAAEVSLLRLLDYQMNCAWRIMLSLIDMDSIRESLQVT